MASNLLANAAFYTSTPLETGERDRLILENLPHVRWVAMRIHEKIGGTSFISRIVASVPSAANAEHYAKIVLEAGLRRAVIQAANEVEGEAYDLDVGHSVFVPAGAEHRFVGYEQLSVLVIFDK